jgi:hypothetical protein
MFFVIYIDGPLEFTSPDIVTLSSFKLGGKITYQPPSLLIFRKEEEKKKYI